MFDDILGKREEKIKPYLGEKRAEGTARPHSVGGVSSPDGMQPNKKPVPPTVTGLKGRPIATPKKAHEPVEQEEPELDLWDCDCDDDGECNGTDCDCGCLQTLYERIERL